jgi:DNA-binding protein
MFLSRKPRNKTPFTSNPTTLSMVCAMSQSNLVRIGKKPVMNYVTACVTLFNSGNGEVMVRARGQAIEKAIDTVQMLRHSFLKYVLIKSINLGSEDVTRYDGTRGNISTIEILLSRGETEDEGEFEEDESVETEQTTTS